MLPPAAVGLGPEVLLPTPGASDQVVARVGELELRRSHAFAALLSANPRLALTAIDMLVVDVLVARHAQQFGITLAEAQVAERLRIEEESLRQQVQAELGSEVDFATYVWRQFGMALPDWRTTLRTTVARRLYLGYVIRYLALREDRVWVRYLVHRDRKVVEEAVAKARQGADFATLALRWSEDAYRREGGLLPPFARSFPHFAAAAAFTLEPGQVSDPLETRNGEVVRWYAVFCLERLTGRDVPFAAVREELDRDLEQKPIEEIETRAYALRWRSQVEEAPAATPERLPVDR